MNSVELTQKIAKRIKKIKIIQTKDLNLTIKILGNSVALRAQNQENLLAGLEDFIENYNILSMSMNGNCFALLRRKK